MSGHARTLALACVAVTLALAPAAAAAQHCFGQPLEARRVAVAARYAHFEEAHDLGAELAARGRGPLVFTARAARRDFDLGEDALLTVRGDAAYAISIAGLSVCPTVGFGRERLDELEIILAPIGVGISARVPLGAGALLPYVVPGMVHSRAAIPGHTRVSTDFDLRAGANLQLGRVLLGAGWERRYTAAVDGAPFVRAGVAF